MFIGSPSAYGTMSHNEFQEKGHQRIRGRMALDLVCQGLYMNSYPQNCSRRYLKILDSAMARFTDTPAIITRRNCGIYICHLSVARRIPSINKELANAFKNITITSVIKNLHIWVVKI